MSTAANHNANANGAIDEYMSQEEEWKRDEHLDPMWEQQQRKTFTIWCNSHLSKINVHLDDITTDFRDGIKLMLLLETISGEHLAKPERGKLRFHQIANVCKALEFIEQKGVRLISIGAEEVVDGNVKMTLGMIWTIILRFAIQNISVEDSTAKEGLLLWCKRKTEGYRGVNVQNFHTSWKDGLAFCALIHRHRPELLDYHTLHKDNVRENLNLAFDVAEKHLGIPRMLDAEDLIDSPRPDEKCIMAYLSSYYHTFVGSQKAGTASSRVCRVLKVDQDNESLKKSYDHLSTELLEWIKLQLPWLNDRTGGDELALIRGRQEEFRKWRTTVKPPRLEEKAKLETDFNALQTRLRLMGRPPYVPASGRMLKDVTDAWQTLEHAERDFADWLMRTFERRERLHYLLEKFKRKCSSHEEWAACPEVSALLAQKDAQPDYWQLPLHDIKAMERKHDAFKSELESRKPRVDQIASIAAELRELECEQIDEVETRTSSICNTWELIGQLSDDRTALLYETEQVLERIEQLHLSFAKLAAPLRSWLDGAREDLQDIVVVNSREEIDEIIACHDQFKATLHGVDPELDNVRDVEKVAVELCSQYQLNSANPYTALTAAQLQSLWDEIQQSIPERDRLLDAEQKRQVQNEADRAEMQKSVDTILPWIKQRLDDVKRISLLETGSLESQLDQLKQLCTAVEAYKPNMEHLEQTVRQLHESMAFDNRTAAFRIEELRVGWEQLQASLRHSLNEIKDHILIRDSKGIKPEQLDEFRKCFNHFDRDEDRKLDPKSFRACLLSLGGMNITDDKKGDLEFAQIMAQVDPNRTGLVTFDAFLDFFTRETADEDSPSKMVSAFRVMADDRAFITEAQLRAHLPESQVAYCLARMKPYQGAGAEPGGLDYHAFVCSLYGESDF